MTYHELLCRLADKGVEVQSVMGNVLALSTASKKRPGHVEIAVPDEFIPKIFSREVIPLLLFLPTKEAKEVLDEEAGREAE